MDSLSCVRDSAGLEKTAFAGAAIVVDIWYTKVESATRMMAVMAIA